MLKRDEIASAMDITREQTSTADQSSRALDVLVDSCATSLMTTQKIGIIRTERGVGYVFAIDVTTCES